jgi:hypothetical protein
MGRNRPKNHPNYFPQSVTKPPVKRYLRSAKGVTFEKNGFWPGYQRETAESMAGLISMFDMFVEGIE